MRKFDFYYSPGGYSAGAGVYWELLGEVEAQDAQEALEKGRKAFGVSVTFEVAVVRAGYGRDRYLSDSEMEAIG